MDSIDIQQARTDLSSLIERVSKGEIFVIERHGKPVARLEPCKLALRTPGRLKGRIRIGPDFDDSLPGDLAKAFQ